MRSAMLLTTAIVLVAALSLPGAAAPEEPQADPGSRLLASRGPSVATVTFVLKFKLSVMGQTQEKEMPVEVPGAVIDAGGIVVTAHEPLDPRGTVMQMIPDEYRDQVDLQASVNALKVILGGEEKGRDARIVVREAELGLAFLAVVPEEGEKLAALDLTRTPGAPVGEKLNIVTRLAERFARAPVLSEIRVSGLVSRPRSLLALSRGSETFCGLPAFRTDGSPAGIVCRLIAETSEPKNPLGAMFGAGAGPASVRAFLLRGEELDRVLVQVRKEAAESK